jgi:phosphoglycerate dehydrogenase-like enzyme
VVAAAHLDHGHIYGMCNGLVEAGAELRWVYDPDPAKVEAFVGALPLRGPARSLDEVLDDPDVRLVAAAAVPSERCDLGIRVLEAGKDYFTDKAPITTLDQLARARDAVAAPAASTSCTTASASTPRAACARASSSRTAPSGASSRCSGLGPHRLNAASRPDWFFDKARYGGILVDLGSHQIEQFLHYTGARTPRSSAPAPTTSPPRPGPGIEDFGEASLRADNGASNYFRVDWFTPDGLPTWGDGRTIILGTDGYIEMRKYIDLARHDDGDHLYLVDHAGVQHHGARRPGGLPVLRAARPRWPERTERAMTQEHAFKAAELCLRAQQVADGHARITRAVLAALPRCRVVVRYGVGTDTVDVDAATEHGVAVCNVPDYGVEEVSDHALALLLALGRRIVTLDRAVRGGDWSLASSPDVRRLRGRVLGLVGLGRIGRAVARKALALGLEVVAYDPVAAPPAPSVTHLGLDELLARSDYVSLHAPLVPATRHLFDDATFRRMKPGAFLINTARGGLVDTDALTRALADGRLAGAGIDVLEQEPIAPDHPLLDQPNCLLTPHAGWFSQDAFAELKTKAAEEAVAVLTGAVPRSCLNPEALVRAG